MLNGFMKNVGGAVKFCIGIGLVGGVLLMVSLRGCSLATNKYDSTNVKTATEGAIKLQKMADDKAQKFSNDKAIEKSAEMTRDVLINQSDNQTELEAKRLEIDARGVIDQNSLEQKKTLDVNQQADREFELEKMRIQLLQAEKLKQDGETERLKIESERSLKESENSKKIEAEKVKAKAKSDAERAKANAAAAAAKEKREKEKEELELLKMLTW